MCVAPAFSRDALQIYHFLAALSLYNLSPNTTRRALPSLIEYHPDTTTDTTTATPQHRHTHHTAHVVDRFLKECTQAQQRSPPQRSTVFSPRDLYTAVGAHTHADADSLQR